MGGMACKIGCGCGTPVRVLCCTYGNGLYVGGLGTSTYWTVGSRLDSLGWSCDGVEWNSIGLPFSDINCVARVVFLKGVFVALLYKSSSFALQSINRVVYSIDGKDWKEVNGIPPAVVLGVGNPDYSYWPINTGITSNDQCCFLAATYPAFVNKYYYYSLNGIDWEEGEWPDNFLARKTVTLMDRRVVVIGESRASVPMSFVTENGARLSEFFNTAYSNNNQLVNAILFNNKIIATLRQNIHYTSEDNGVSWQGPFYSNSGSVPYGSMTFSINNNECVLGSTNYLTIPSGAPAASSDDGVNFYDDKNFGRDYVDFLDDKFIAYGRDIENAQFNTPTSVYFKTDCNSEWEKKSTILLSSPKECVQTSSISLNYLLKDVKNLHV